MVTRQYKTVPIKRVTKTVINLVRMSLESESVFGWLRERVENNWYSSHARHVSMWFGQSFPASYD